MRPPLLTTIAETVLRPFSWVFGGMRGSNGVLRQTANVQLARISLADQWQSLSGTLTQAIGRAEQAHVLQSAATRQLDLAQYGLSTLMDELSAVMTVPGRRGPAMVHRFAPLAQPAASRALAA